MIPTTEVPIQVEARDDFGVSLLGINFKIGDGPEETLAPRAGSRISRFTAAALETLYLEKHSLDYKGAITYYAFAEDNYPPKPHRVVSDLRFIDILPFKQEYQFVEGEGLLQRQLGFPRGIDRPAARQSESHLRARARNGGRRRGCRRLAKYEGELHAATAEFAQGIAAIAGPIPALEEAVDRDAVGRDVRSRPRTLPAARPLEEAALKGLIAARQNLRKTAQAKLLEPGECLPQVRPPAVTEAQAPPAEKEKQQLAALENDLRELARREEKFSEEIEPKGSGGPQLDPPPQGNSNAKAREVSSKGSKSGSSSGRAAARSRAAQPGRATKAGGPGSRAAGQAGTRRRSPDRKCPSRLGPGREHGR